MGSSSPSSPRDQGIIPPAGPYLLRVRPIGLTASSPGVDVMNIKAGLIQHNTIYYDGASFARQVGLLPTKDSGADKALVRAFNARTRAAKRLRRKS